MSKELVCPFCNKKLEPIGTSGQFQCGTWGCDASFNFIATRDVWEYIDRTRKALGVAKSKLNGIHRLYSKAFYTREDWLQVCMEMVDKANTALDKIKALEQKDVK